MKKRLFAIVAAGALSLSLASSAFAHECEVVNKPTGAGSAGTFNFITGAMDLRTNPQDRPVGAFITVTDGASFSVDVMQHKTLPAGALNAGPGDSQCDRVGVDSALVCFGG